MTPITEKSLAEHLRITEADIWERKALLDFDHGCEAKLATFHDSAVGFVDTVVDDFYRHQLSIPEVDSIIGDSDTLDRITQAMRGYVLALFGGKYDADYVNSRLRIGKVHARIGLSPKLYISALHRLEELVSDQARRHGATPDLLSALHKLFLFDLQLVFDTYIQGLVSQVEFSHERLQTYAETLEIQIATRTEEMERLVRTDPLTGLWNRREFFERLRDEVMRAQRRRTGLALVFLDIDDFKSVNDTHGHVEGDRLLREVALAIQTSIGMDDVAFRYGGDEFCLLLPGADEEGARRVCDALADRLPEHTSLSYGVAKMRDGDIKDLDALVARADADMYEAKAGHHALSHPLLKEQVT